MHLSYEEIDRSNKLRANILTTADTETLKKITCKKCHGTGLSSLRYSMYDKKWEAVNIDTESFCDYCKGLGFSEDEETTSLIYECHYCHGTGVDISGWSCTKCVGFGYHNDWIRNAIE